MNDMDVRARILHAATRLFAEHGYAGTSVRQVVTSAGVTKPMVYYYFDNKEALFTEAVRSQIDAVSARIRQALGSDGTVRERLLAYLQSCLDSVRELPDATRLFVRAMHPTDRSQPRLQFSTYLESWTGDLAALLEEGRRDGRIRQSLDVDTAASLLIGCVDVYLVAALEGAPIPDGTAERILDVLIHGLEE